MTTADAKVELVAKAIYDAPDTQSGDTVGTVIWNSEHLFYDSVDGEEIVDTARRASMPVCRDAARAAITALEASHSRTEANDDGSLTLDNASVQRLMDYGVLHFGDNGWFVSNDAFAMQAARLIDREGE